MGGDRVHYPFDAGTPTANLLTVKLLINSVILMPGTRFFTMDIKNFYLCTPMSRYECMQLKLSDMPEYVITHYKLLNIATLDVYVYCEIRQGMYGLPQAGIIAQELLAKSMATPRARPLPACGNTSGVRFGFPLLSKTLGSNTSARSTCSTCYRRCKNIISARSNQKGKYTADSPSNGTIRARRCT